MEKLEETLKLFRQGGATFAGRSKLVKWDDNSKGSFVKFALNTMDEDGLVITESPFKGCLEGAKDGQEFYLIAIMTSDVNKKPDNQSINELEKPKNYIAMAKLLAKNPSFIAYVTEKCGLPSDDIGAELFIEQYCWIQSCAEFKEGSEAVSKLLELRRRHEEWERFKLMTPMDAG